VILLDTHIWVWLSTRPERITRTQRAIIDNTHHQLGICSISLWEIALGSSRGRIAYEGDLNDWLQAIVALPRSVLLPLSAEIAIESVRLPGQFHRDPADQIIVATARVHDCELMTSDGKILNYPHVRHVKIDEGETA